MHVAQLGGILDRTAYTAKKVVKLGLCSFNCVNCVLQTAAAQQEHSRERTQALS